VRKYLIQQEMGLIARRPAVLAACGLAAAAGVSASAWAQAASAQRPLPPLPVTRLDPGTQETSLDTPRRLSLAFAKPVAVRDLLLLLVADTPFSVALDPDVTGTFIGDLKDITLRQALESVLAPRGLAYSVEGTLIRVFPRRTESRFFDVNFVNVRRAWHRSLAADGGSLETETASDPFADLEKGVAAMLSPGGRVHVDRRAGLVNVTDYPEQLARVALYVEALQVRASRQVRLQARIIDAAGNRTVTLPDTVTLNNEPAVMRATADTRALALTIVPQVAADGLIQLSLSPLVADAGTRSGIADTVARVRDGGTVSIGLAPGLVVEVTATIMAPPAGAPANR
jgi:hypothetical protein